MAQHQDSYQFSPDPTESQLRLIEEMEDEALAGPSNKPAVIPKTPLHLQGMQEMEVRTVFKLK